MFSIRGTGLVGTLDPQWSWPRDQEMAPEG